MPFAAEALLLGVSSGPACLSSCGPVVVPWLAAEAQGIGGTARRLAVFLGGRLAGYLLFAALVVTLPVLTKRRTQCAFFCPFGVFQSLFNKTNVFDIRIDRDQCADCVSCQRSCPIQALDKQSVEAGKTLMSWMLIELFTRGVAATGVRVARVPLAGQR